jgi:hypothetical protein
MDLKPFAVVVVYRETISSMQELAINIEKEIYSRGKL